MSDRREIIRDPHRPGKRIVRDSCADCGLVLEGQDRYSVGLTLNVHDGETRCDACSDAWWSSDAGRAVIARIDTAAARRAESGTISKVAPGTWEVRGHPTAEDFAEFGWSRFSILVGGTKWGPFTPAELADMPAVKPYRITRD